MVMASKRRLRRKGCDRKQVFNKEDAGLHARRRFGQTGQFIKAYKCSFGHHWHIGHYKPGTHRTGVRV